MLLSRSSGERVILKLALHFGAQYRILNQLTPRPLAIFAEALILIPNLGVYLYVIIKLVLSQELTNDSVEDGDRLVVEGPHFLKRYDHQRITDSSGKP